MHGAGRSRKGCTGASEGGEGETREGEVGIAKEGCPLSQPTLIHLYARHGAAELTGLTLLA
jgi:hypothetical protein